MTDPQLEAESPRSRAERLYGAASHIILVSDRGPTVAFMGWRLGGGRAEAQERSGVSRVVEVEIYFDEAGRYAVAERSVRTGDDGRTTLDAIVTRLNTPAGVRGYCDAASMEPMRDAALCNALDHVAKSWPHLERRPRQGIATPAFLRAVLKDNS